jgi:hypothetical protein
MTRTPIRYAVAGLVGAAAIALAAQRADAQIPEVQPDGSRSEPAAPPPAPPSTPIVVTPQGQPAPAPDSPAAATAGGAGGYYHVDENGLTQETDGDVLPAGTVPAVHTVRSGDTLWDLCFSYFNNPWEWPRVWSYNPEITNPHWIYPGDQLRLRARGNEPPAERSPGNRPSATQRPAARTGVYFDMRQLAFVSAEELALGIEIDGSPEEKLMLSTGDEVYLRYPEGKPPRVGLHLAVYLERERIEHPESGEEIGAFVRVVGEVEVISAARGKLARAVVLDSVDAIERGMRVGPVQRQFHNVQPVAAEVELEGLIVAEIGAEELIGARQVVLIDRGKQQRVKVGNTFHVIRRGDAYEAVMGPYSNIGKNDRRYPARSIGEILVVQAGSRTAVAVVVRSDKELGVGDRVLMNRGRARPPAP